MALADALITRSVYWVTTMETMASVKLMIFSAETMGFFRWRFTMFPWMAVPSLVKATEAMRNTIFPSKTAASPTIYIRRHTAM
ncbi:hypothetical protein D3C76_1755590 [compost metagenome]